IIAGIALDMGIITQEIFSILVFMAIFTTATVPVLLKWGTDWLKERGELVRAGGVRDGVLVLSAGPLARKLARTLVEHRPVSLVDRNPAHCRAAQMLDLDAICGNALEEQVLGEARAGSAEFAVAMTANTE